MIEGRNERIVEVAIGTPHNGLSSGSYDIVTVSVRSELDLSMAGAKAEELVLERESKGSKHIAFAKALTIWNDDMMQPFWDRLDEWEDEPNFRCPSCNLLSRIEAISVGAIVKEYVDQIRTGGYWDPVENDYEILDKDETRFECAECGWTIPADGDEEFSDWYFMHRP